MLYRTRKSRWHETEFTPDRGQFSPGRGNPSPDPRPDFISWNLSHCVMFSCNLSRGYLWCVTARVADVTGWVSGKNGWRETEPGTAQGRGRGQGRRVWQLIQTRTEKGRREFLWCYVWKYPPISVNTQPVVGWRKMYKLDIRSFRIWVEVRSWFICAQIVGAGFGNWACLYGFLA